MSEVVVMQQEELLHSTISIVVSRSYDVIYPTAGSETDYNHVREKTLFREQLLLLLGLQDRYYTVDRHIRRESLSSLPGS